MQAEVEVKVERTQVLFFSALTSALTFRKAGGPFQHPARARIVAQPGRMPEGPWKQPDSCGLNGQRDAKSSLSLVRRRATPVSRAAAATALATRGTTSLSNTLGMM